MIVLVLLVALAVGFVFTLPLAAIAMLLLGGLHADISAVPALGFWTVWKATMLLGVVGSTWRGSNVEAKSSK